MRLKGKCLAATSVLMLVMRAFSADAPTCDASQYKHGNECCSMCPPGKQVKQDCTKDTRTSCLPCPDGSYMDKPNGRKRCTPCSMCDSGLGLIEKQSCSATSDTVCEAAEGFFCMDSTSSSCSAAQKHSSCNPGQYISKQGTSSSDSECSDCRDGTFSDGSSSSCPPHTQCESENLHQIKAGTSSSDAECGEKKPSSLTGVIISLVVVSLLLILIVAAGVLYCCFREKIKSKICAKQKNAANHREEKPNGGTEEPAAMPLNPAGEQNRDVEDTPL